MRTWLLILSALSFSCRTTPHVRFAELWRPGDPATSEALMRRALRTATDDADLIIRTHIARTYMLRGQFDKARSELEPVQARLDDAGSEAKARYWLELGRSYVSHRHPASSQTEQARALARDAYRRALAVSLPARLDSLSVDILHMFAFVDPAPADQMKWNREALRVVLGSDQPAARRWEPSIRSNLGEALFDLGRYESALEQFESALVLRQHAGASAALVRDATWHVGRALRKLGQIDRALSLQQRLASEALTANDQRYYIHDELALLYAAIGDQARAEHFAEHSAALRSP